jgi:hypothetical protein
MPPGKENCRNNLRRPSLSCVMSGKCSCSCLQDSAGDDAGTAMSRTSVEHVEVRRADQTIEMRIDEIEPGVVPQ